MRQRDIRNIIKLFKLLFDTGKNSNKSAREGTPSEGRIYVLGLRENPDITKVGMTTGSVEGRVRSLQTGNPNEIYIHAVFIFQDVTPQDVRDMERHCHELLRNYRMKGEWFSVSPEAAAEVIGEAMDIAEEDATKGFIERNIGWILLALFFLWLFF